MATAGSSRAEHLSAWLREEDHPVWYRSFSPGERQRMIDDDLAAGLQVPLIITAVIFAGVILAILSVSACW